MVAKQNKLYWTAKAQKDLKEIARYYKKRDKVSTVAISIVTDANLLATHPFLGFKEPLLEHKPEELRSLISSHYKIIYYIQDEIVFIITIFDCRQDPNKLKTSI